MAAAKNSRDRKAERQMRLHRARGLAELERVAPGSATQGLWLGNRKEESKVVGKNRSRLLGRRTVGEVMRRKMRKKSQRQIRGENAHI